MSRLLLLLLCFTLPTIAFTQQILKLEEGKVIKFPLDQVTAIRMDTIHYSNLPPLDGPTPPSKYWIEVTFGLKTFDLKVYESETNKLVTAVFTLLKSSSGFKLKRKDAYSEEYELEHMGLHFTVSLRDQGSFAEGVYVQVSYSRKKPESTKLAEWIIASGTIAL